MTAVPTDTSYVAERLVDHHCHGLVRRDLDRPSFEMLMNEGAGPGRWTGSPFDSMLGVAVRRHCAPLLDLEPHADPDAYLERRQVLGHDEVARRMLGAAGLDTVLVDTGYVPDEICSPEEVATLAGGRTRAHEILRLETTAQELLADGTDPRELTGAIEARLAQEVQHGVVGAKSIAAYRCGLELLDARPGDNDVAEALRRQQPRDGEGWRISDRTVISALAWTAVDAGLPLQFHVGYGDNDVDLLRCDPLLLTPFLRATLARGVPVLLLHNYPFHRHAAYLAQVFDHVFVDLGLCVHNTGALSRQAIREILELVPFPNLLHSSDAFGLPELYLLGSLLFRRGLGAVLADLVGADELAERDAVRVGAMVAADNARRAYGLSH